MKKKIAIGSLFAIVVITAMILLIGFNTPVFYNTEYSVYENGEYVGYFNMTTESSITYKGVTGQESTIYYRIKNNVLTFNHSEFTIKSKFKLVNENYKDVVARPLGGGYSTFCLLLAINIPSLIALATICGMDIYKKQKYKNEQIGKVKVLEDLLIKKNIISQKDLQKSQPKQKEESSNFVHDEIKEPITHCKNCGYQLFEEDTQCPNCGGVRKNK